MLLGWTGGKAIFGFGREQPATIQVFSGAGYGNYFHGANIHIGDRFHKAELHEVYGTPLRLPPEICGFLKGCWIRHLKAPPAPNGSLSRASVVD